MSAASAHYVDVEALDWTLPEEAFPLRSAPPAPLALPHHAHLPHLAHLAHLPHLAHLHPYDDLDHDGRYTFQHTCSFFVTLELCGNSVCLHQPGQGAAAAPPPAGPARTHRAVRARTTPRTAPTATRTPSARYVSTRGVLARSVRVSVVLMV